MGKELKIGTLNLNGEAWWLINNRRIPLSWKETIQEKLTDKTEDGLSKLLKAKEYDIIAVQELVLIERYHKKINDLIEKEGYKLVEPPKS